MLAAFAGLERDISKERECEGIEEAKAADNYAGRKRRLTDEHVAVIAEAGARGVPKSVMARRYGVSPATIHRELASWHAR